MCSLIPDQLRSPEAGCSLAADGASAAASPRSLEMGGGRGVRGEGGCCGLWLSSNDGAQGGDFAYAKKLRGAMIELIVQPASTSVESGLDLFEALK